MITIASRSRDELPGELRDGIDEYRRTLYRLTDRLRLGTGPGTVLGWGDLVLLVGWRGKIELVQRLSADAGRPAEAAHLAQYRALLRSWLRYRSQFSAEVTAELQRQYGSAVVERYAAAHAHPDVLRDPSNLEHFFRERETIELFLRGAQVEWPDGDFRSAVAALDRETARFVVQEALPGLEPRSAEDIRQRWRLDWLPLEFWWRHLRTETGARGGRRGSAG